MLAFAQAGGAVDREASENGAREVAIETPDAHRRRRGGRKPLPEFLPREVVELRPTDEHLQCECCKGEETRIGEDRTEELEYVPSSMFVRVYVRPKYACRKCENGVVQAALPARPIEKGRPGPGLLAHVVTSKYADHLPLYRLERIFPRQGIEVSRKTLSQWCGAVSDLLKPVATQIAAEVLSSQWVQSDDTTVEVQDASRSPACPRGHIWTYRGSDGSAFYDFTWNRNSEGPLREAGEDAKSVTGGRGTGLRRRLCKAADHGGRVLGARKEAVQGGGAHLTEGSQPGDDVDRGDVRARAQCEEEAARR